MHWHALSQGYLTLKGLNTWKKIAVELSVDSMETSCVACADEIGQHSWRDRKVNLKLSLSHSFIHYLHSLSVSLALYFDLMWTLGMCIMNVCVCVCVHACVCVWMCWITGTSVCSISSIICRLMRTRSRSRGLSLLQETSCLSWFSKIHFTSSAKLAGPHLSRAANIWYAKLWQVLVENLKWCICTPLSAEQALIAVVFLLHTSLRSYVNQKVRAALTFYLLISLYGNSDGDEV